MYTEKWEDASFSCVFQTTFCTCDQFKYYNSHRQYPLGPAFKPATVAPPVTKQTEIGKTGRDFSKKTWRNDFSWPSSNLSCICPFVEAAPKVSQSQAESDISASKPFPALGGHPGPESGKTQPLSLTSVCLCMPASLAVVFHVCCCLSPSWFLLPPGAILPLALGLIITALLLLMIGCRLRLVRHKLKKTRPLTTEESDYLINGMYL